MYPTTTAPLVMNERLPDPAVKVFDKSFDKYRVLLASVVTVGLLGFLTTEAFNHTFGRVAPFDAEPVTSWIENGVRSLVAPVVYLGIMLIVREYRRLHKK